MEDSSLNESVECSDKGHDVGDASEIRKVEHVLEILSIEDNNKENDPSFESEASSAGGKEQTDLEHSETIDGVVCSNEDFSENVIETNAEIEEQLKVEQLEVCRTESITNQEDAEKVIFTCDADVSDKTDNKLNTPEESKPETKDDSEIIENEVEENQWHAKEEEANQTEDSKYSDEEEDFTDEEDSKHETFGRKRREASDQSDEDNNMNTDDEMSEEEVCEATDAEEQIEGKRFSGDGQEEPKMEEEDDRKNPAYVPRKGTYFEHDLRVQADENEDPEASDKKEVNKKKSRADDNKWEHDKFDAFEQAPKRTHEIVRRYGYDIRRDGHHNENTEHDLKNYGGLRKDRTNASGDHYRKPLYRLRNEMKERSTSPKNYPQRQTIRHRDEGTRDVREDRNEKSRPREHKRNPPQGRRSYRTEIITTRGGPSGEKEVESNEGEIESQNKSAKATSTRKAPHRGTDNEGTLRPAVESQKNNRFRNEIDSFNRNKNYMPRKIPREEGQLWERDTPREYAPKQPERKGYSYHRNQDQQPQEYKQPHRDSMQPHRDSLQPHRDSMQPHRDSMQPHRDSMQPHRDSLQPHRDFMQQRPPRLAKHFMERPPREIEIVNSNISRGKSKVMEDEENTTQVTEVDQIKNKNNDPISGSSNDSSATSTTSGVKSSESNETRKGWAGGEFTPSWRTDPQQRRSEEETNVVRASKRYSSSRQQQQKHQQFQNMEYYQQQYPQYPTNSTPTGGPVYDAMIPHPAYVPHSALVTNSYAPFYSTLPGSVYPNPPVYQHPQLTHFPNSSYMQHVTQGAEGHVFYGHQGVPQGQYFEPQQTSVSQMRATSAIPIVNPQDIGGQNQGGQPEAVAVRSQ